MWLSIPILLNLPIATAFHAPHSILNTQRRHRALLASKSENEIDISTTFNALIRDLQIENVPILGCDADNVFSLSAALWTTLSEMSENDSADKICLLMEDIPMPAVNAFIKELEVLKKQDRLMEQLPELKRVTASMLSGAGGGMMFPAVILKTDERTNEEKIENEERMKKAEEFDQTKCTIALQHFVQRMFVDLDANPISVGTQSLRFSKTSDMCTTLAIFWNCICELTRGDVESTALRDDDVGSILVSLPGIAPTSHDRFAAATEVLSHQLSLFECQSLFDVTYCHPFYERKLMTPVDATAYGHIPPPSYLRPILRSSSECKDDAERLSWDELNLLDYERRSPHTIIRIDRMTTKKKSTDLTVGDGKVEAVTGVDKYAKTMVRLASLGEVELDNALKKEIDMMT